MINYLYVNIKNCKNFPGRVMHRKHKVKTEMYLVQTVFQSPGDISSELSLISQETFHAAV